MLPLWYPEVEEVSDPIHFIALINMIALINLIARINLIALIYMQIT